MAGRAADWDGLTEDEQQAALALCELRRVGIPERDQQAALALCQMSRSGGVFSPAPGTRRVSSRAHYDEGRGRS